MFLQLFSKAKYMFYYLGNIKTDEKQRDLIAVE